MHGGIGFVVKISDKHSCGLNIKGTICPIINLIQGVLIKAKCSLCRSGNILGLGTSSSLAITVQRDTSILCMDSSIMSQEQVTAHKSALALLAFEWSLLCICIKVSI